MTYRGYHFFVGDLELPYAPSELNVTIGSNNQIVDLINGSQINILKDPKLQEIAFDIELPRGRQYPFANKLVDPKVYLDYFNKLLSTKIPTTLLITRPNPFSGGYSKPFQDTIYKKVSLEGYSWKEDAENAYDLKVSLKFKEYIEYGTIKSTTIVKTEQKPKEVAPLANHTVKKGDTLWGIARKYYGTSGGLNWRIIYNANKKVIEDAAIAHGKKSSSEGHWIYPGTILKIPSLKK